MNRPKGGVTEPNQTGSVGKSGVAYPNGQPYRYVPNDCSVGDLDGDGEYEIVVKWDPTNAQDNSYYGITGKVYLDAYKLDGTQLWRIDLGKNIRAGAHYTQFLVYDFDGDGLAELVCKTAPGTVDGLGANVIMGNDNPNADSSQLNIYTTTSSSSHRLFTLMHDPVYRLGVAWQNVAYNQPPHLGFYIGDGLAAVQQPAITTVKYDPATHLNQPVAERTRVYTASGQLFIEADDPLIAVTLYSMAGHQLYRADHLNQTSFSTALPQGVHLLLVTITTASGSEVKRVAVL